MGPKTTESKVRAVIFDFDGVICDTEPLHIKSWQILFALKGIDVTESELLAGIGVTDLNLLDGIFARRGMQESPAEWQLEKRSIYLDLLQGSVRTFPGALELVRALSRNWPMAIASSAWRAAIDIVTRRLDIGEHFRVIVGKEDVTAHKPAPEVFLTAASRLGVHPPDCAVIEDSPTGLQAAKAAGMRRVAVTNSFPAAELEDAHLIVHSLEETERIRAFLTGNDGGRETL